MKYKMLALFLALTVASWAQTATQTTPATPQQSTVPAEKAKCACCDKMTAADSKDAHACCADHAMKGDMAGMKDGKEMASCCAGKEAKSTDGKDAMACMKGDKDKAAASCCKDGCSKDSCGKGKTASACCGEECGKDGGKGCCAGMKSDKTAKSCCTKELHS
jgi:hypothetical protein